jgi:KTSC domain
MEDGKDSKLIKRFGHDPESKLMRVEFHSGAHYEYLEVEGSTMQKFRSAETLGKGFHMYIRGKHKHRMV